jgi:hypothetical protein
MAASALIRARIEASLADRIPSALSPVPRAVRPAAATGIESVDQALAGGIPVGAITEMVGPECSGRSSLALACVARATQAGNVCAWVDASDAFDPESAAAAGVGLSRLLWVRMSPAVRPWSRMEQALRVTDLLLQAGGFNTIVLDMAGVAPQHAARVPLATWFRYRAAAERTQSSVLLLTQSPCAQSSAALHLQFGQPEPARHCPTVFTGMSYRLEVVRQRFETCTPQTTFARKPPQKQTAAGWQSHVAWVCAQ